MQVCNEDFENYSDENKGYQNGVGGILDHKYPVLCLGNFGTEIMKNCRILGQSHMNYTTDLYPQNTGPSKVKIGTAGVMWNSYALWITGGANEEGSQGYKNTRFVKKHGKEMIWSRELPYPVSHHCLVKLDSNTFVLIGGKNYAFDVYVLEWSYEKNIQGPSTLFPRHSGFGCVVFHKYGTPIVMVAGGAASDSDTEGQSTVELLERGSNQWVEGAFMF